MKIRCIIVLVLLSLFPVLFAGCCTANGTFATTEEHTVDLGHSVQNVFLDGDGIN